MRQITLGSLFDGIGAAPYAASFFGIRPLWASEILPAAISVTRRHFPGMAHLGDITALDGAFMPPVDVVVFRSPCQDLSSAAGGNRKGLAGERSGLFMEAIRIINEMREATDGKYPRYAIWENVPGCFSSNARRDYQAVLEAFTGCEIPMPRSGKWANAGLVRSERVNLAWCVFNAADFGLAQRRKRVFLIADFAGGRPEEILLVPKGLRWHPAAGGGPGQGAAAAAGAGADGAEPIIAFNGGASPQAGSIAYSEQVSPTLKSASSGLRTPCVCEPQIARTLTARGDSSPCADRGQNIVAHPQLAGTLCASAAGLSRPAGIASETDLAVAYATFSRQRSDEFQGSGIASTQTARQYKDSTDLCVSYCLQGNLIGRNDCNGPAGSGINEEISFTLNATDHHAVAVYCRNLKEAGALSGTLQSKSNTGYSLNYQNPVREGFVVRRLTPIECERLMGLPDGYTAFGHDGVEISDSRRYQMIGNSIAVPVLAYIMQGVVDAMGGQYAA